MIGPWELKGLQSILPTPSKPGSDHIDATDTVDLDEAARVVEQLIKDGVGGIWALGTMGECATTSQADYERFVDCILSTARKRVPMFVGTTALGTHEIARRIRFVRELGADGTLLGMPMWQPLTLEGAIKYFGSVSEEFPDFGIMVYANSRAFRFDFGIDFWEAVAKKAPTIKHAKGGASPNNLLQALEVTNRTINFVPNDGGALAMAEVSRETTTACWSATMGPHPATALMNAIASGDMDRAKQISDELHSAGAGVRSFLSDSDFFASFNIQFEKIRMNSAGYVNAGPMRPPYDYVPKDFEDACIENGKRFAALEKKYAAMLAPTAGGGES
jgi:dihydrodipicolinate synthase/N-acetylneuraminate lyase